MRGLTIPVLARALLMGTPLAGDSRFFPSSRILHVLPFFLGVGPPTGLFGCLFFSARPSTFFSLYDLSAGAVRCKYFFFFFFV